MTGEVEAFLDHIVYENGESANTREAYASDLAFFIDSAIKQKTPMLVYLLGQTALL